MTSARWFKAGSKNGLFCRRNCKQEFLDNERILRYFAHMDVSDAPPEDVSHREPSDADRAHWDALSEAERRQIAPGFNQFFELTPDEKQETLNTLSDAERAQMEKTLQAFDKMPPGPAGRMRQRIRKIREHERVGTGGIFEKRRALVANVTRRTPGVARSRHTRPRMAAAARGFCAARAGGIQFHRGHESQLNVREFQFAIFVATL